MCGFWLIQPEDWFEKVDWLNVLKLAITHLLRRQHVRLDQLIGIDVEFSVNNDEENVRKITAHGQRGCQENYIIWRKKSLGLRPPSQRSFQAPTLGCNVFIMKDPTFAYNIFFQN